METKKEMEARDNCDQSGNEKLVPVHEFRMQKTMGRTNNDGPERVKSLRDSQLTVKN